jgi:hypothetical protein
VRGGEGEGGEGGADSHVAVDEGRTIEDIESVGEKRMPG